MTKVGILSDTHGWIHPQIVSLMNNCALIVHAGDVIDANTLEVFTQQIFAVQGNNDGHLQLPQVETVKLPGGDLAIQHGHQHGWHTPSHDLLRKAHPHAKAIIYGHTHKQVIDKTASPWVINPGAGGEIRNGGSSKCLVLNASTEQEWQITAHAF
ncbi:MAG: metallophosphoesterase family protein [Candidatus Thioglobus sp.]|nr:metallophosphoesterase family protein [Candidatus Thioglobus sp.]